MTSGAKAEKIQEIISIQEFKGNLGYGSRAYVLRALDHSNRTVTALSFFYFLYTRSLGTAYFGAGAVGCIVVVKVFKQFLREQRPVGTYKATYGMPSTHSATMSYYATFITLAASMLPIHPSLYLLPRLIIYPIAPMLAISTAATVCISRIRLGHHTIKQVVVGITVGILYGTAWFWWWYKGSAQTLAWNIVDMLPRSIAEIVR